MRAVIRRRQIMTTVWSMFVVRFEDDEYCSRLERPGAPSKRNRHHDQPNRRQRLSLITPVRLYVLIASPPCWLPPRLRKHPRRQRRTRQTQSKPRIRIIVINSALAGSHLAPSCPHSVATDRFAVRTTGVQTGMSKPARSSLVVQTASPPQIWQCKGG